MSQPFPNLPAALRGAVTTIEHTSTVLQGNPWGDPVTRDITVYTPPGYDRDTARRYPVILVLPPFASTGESLLGRGLTDISLATRVDRLLHGGACEPFIAVLPDAMSSLGGTQFVDSPGIGAYASWVVAELMPRVERDLRTTGRWGVTGRSSGGFGALHLAMAYPGRFGAVGSNAGDMGFDIAYLSGLHEAVLAVRRAGGPRAFVDAFWRSQRPGGHDFAAISLLCVAAAYTTDGGPEADGFPARLPIDFETGALRPEVLESWRRFDPVVRVRQRANIEALGALDLLLIEAGDHDEYLLNLGARRFVAGLESAGIAHTFEEFPGGHRGTAWRFDLSLPRMVEALTSGR